MTERITNVASTPREHAKLARGPGDRLVILLEPLTEVFHDRGTYGANGTTMPKRYRALHPAADSSLQEIEADYPGIFHFSDVFRNANGSRGRREKNKKKRGRYTGLLPGSSGHGFGFCKDHAVSANLQRLSAFLGERVDKEDYDLIWRGYGWWCHRDGPDGGDHRRDREEFHFNYFGDDPERWLDHSGRRTSGGLEAKLNYAYGPFTLDRDGVEEHLIHLGHLDAMEGRPDAIRAFQEDWTLPVDGIAGPQTQRVLCYVGAELRDASTGQPLDLMFP